VCLIKSGDWCPKEDDRQAATRPQRSCTSRIEPRQVRPRTDPVPAPHSIHWLDVADRIRFRLCVQVYRCQHSMAPGLSGRALQHRRSPASAICWPWPARRSASQAVNIYGGRAFCYVGPSAWNAVLKKRYTLSTFRRQLKHFLLLTLLAHRARSRLFYSNAVYKIPTYLLTYLHSVP